MADRKPRYATVLDVPAKGLPKAKQQHPGRPPLVNKRLTRRQELFVKELVSKDGQITMREAAINAGYPPKSAHVRASELTNPSIHPHVCRAIREYRQELDQKYGVEYKRHLRDLQLIRDRALEAGAYSAAVQAEYRRGQAQGDIYVNKTEVRHGSIDQMSKEDVLKALEELKQQYQPLTHDADGAELGRSRSKSRQRIMDILEAEDAPVDVEEPTGDID
ncbi:MAG: Terminase small subunit [Pseudomonadota bacterium]